MFICSSALFLSVHFNQCFLKNYLSMVNAVYLLFFRTWGNLIMIMKNEYSGYLNNEHLNSRLIEVRYSDAWFLLLTGQQNSGQIVCYSNHHSKNRPSDYWTSFDHLTTRLVWYSDPHWLWWDDLNTGLVKVWYLVPPFF